ncbi:NAD-dependent epimerase/dehydratase family protein [Burkholderia sp. LMU1-1-1.1]|uniref:NAD-dependent epimerase/dehydratase family protein n=1 Tax=Burkholderia sp. LMU1-1-1.1 TaxID=3135266 RepID=UPI003442AF27
MNDSATEKPFDRLLLTGAAGGLGQVLRDRIKPWARIVRLSDRADLGEAAEGEEIVRCDLADKPAVLALAEGVDAVLHFGGISVEDRFEPIMQANILGLYNLYEAVHKAGVKRVVYASSNHVTGFYRNTEIVDADMPPRPDGFYGLSKCFGESLSRYYYDRLGIETVCLRIGSSFAQPKNARMMTTYLSYDDLVELLRCALFTPRVGHTIVFGTSSNDTSWWDNRKASHLGFRPKDSSRRFKHLFPDTAQRPGDDPATIFQGGPFVTAGPLY